MGKKKRKHRKEKKCKVEDKDREECDHADIEEHAEKAQSGDVDNEAINEDTRDVGDQEENVENKVVDEQLQGVSLRAKAKARPPVRGDEGKKTTKHADISDGGDGGVDEDQPANAERRK